MTRGIRYIVVFIQALTLLFLTGCADDALRIPDYTRAGEKVTVSVPVTLPSLKVASRADLDQTSLNQVESLWIRTYSSTSGEATSDWVKVSNLPTYDVETSRQVTFSTLSGPSYIVGVANVGNLGITKSDMTVQKPLSELLEGADTWTKFLDIAAVAPCTPMTVRAPLPPLVMAGCFSALAPGGSHPEPARIDEWQQKDFQSFFIPADKETVDFSGLGAIHLRRIVSHVNFNIVPADNLEVEVNSFRVMNAPKWSWLYERPQEDGMETNFGNLAASDDETGLYYTDIAPFGPQFITENADGTSHFDFWQGENKHTGTGSTPPDEASYVLISCNITYKSPIEVDETGAAVEEGGELVDRTAEATYLVRLGHLQGDPADFNCFRNVNYTYNVRINGVDDIRVDAFADDETFPDEEGVVVDLSNNTVNLDAHYSCFNIRLTQEELQDSNFGFILLTYDNGTQIKITDANHRDETGAILDDKGNRLPAKYYDWIELRPTTGEFILADYKPRYGAAGADGKTFLLTDLYDGWNSMTDAMKSDAEGWYTVFVNEYTYEPTYTGANGYADETALTDGRPTWMRYVNQPPRRFYIIVSKNVSPDGNSIYSRSKYGVSQESIMSYYSQQTVTPGGTAVGIEHINETLGMNMRHQYMGGSSLANGRLNTAEWLKSKSGQDINGTPGPPWNVFITPNSPLQIPALVESRAQGGWTLPDRTIATGNPLELPDLTRSAGASSTFNDPQPTDLYNIEGINACLNRNRDNNGNGRIDPDELRWYVPAIDQYLHIILGANSLTDPLMPYERIHALPKVLNHQWSDAPEAIVKDAYYSRYMFMASNDGNNVMWCMEGTSTSTFHQANEWAEYYTRPWNLRCIRNLGSNLTDVQSDIKVTPAFVHSPEDRTIRMTYFDMASIRVNPYFSNGTGAGQMPVHTIASPYNSVYYSFEYAPRDITIPWGFRPAVDNVDNFNSTYGRLRTFIYRNPCREEFGEGWRVPNQMELTMIRNVGGVLYSPLAAAIWLSSTVNYFNQFTGIGSDASTDGKLFLILHQSHGAQLTFDNLRWATDQTFIRCVKDKQ